MATRYVVLAEGFLPATAKLLRVRDESVDAVVVAAGTPAEIRGLAADLNTAHKIVAQSDAWVDAGDQPDPAADHG